MGAPLPQRRGLGTGLVVAIASGALLAGCVGGCTLGVLTSSDGSSSTVTSTVTRTAAAPAPPEPSTPRPAGPQSTIDSDGTYAVGVDILPGVYRTAGPANAGRDCYYKRLASFDSSDIIDNEGSEGPQVVEILPTDVAFSTSNCQTWEKAK